MMGGGAFSSCFGGLGDDFDIPHRTAERDDPLA